jgi:hypothetical protein
MLVSSFNLSQSFKNTPYLFYKNGSNQRSIFSVYGPRSSHISDNSYLDRVPTRASLFYVAFLRLTKLTEVKLF